MSVVGIDFGNLNTVIAVARNRGIDVIANETSNRATPSLVSYSPQQRYLGEGAKTQELSAFRNTVASLKRLVGRPYTDPEVLGHEKKYVNCALVEGDRGEVAAQVDYCGETTTFTYTQVCASYLTRIREITAAELRAPVTDCVISCPGWFSDRQRRALLNAADIAGLNCLKIMNDLTAAALGYGLTKTDLPEDKPRTVVFVDCGQSNYQVAVAEFVKGKLVIKGTAYDRNLGGRDFDDVLANHFIEEFKSKYKMDIGSNAKATFRLRSACEKVKKILSANAVTLLNVECIMNDRDVSAQIERADFEKMATPLLMRLVAPLEKAMAAAGVKPQDVDFVELVGGTTRIPAVKEILANYFGDANKLSTTLNQDEAVSRGCALQCAVISPVFRVRDFSVTDWNGYPIELSWNPDLVPAPKDGSAPESTMPIFDVGNALPSVKQVTLLRKHEPNQGDASADFEVLADYTDAAVSAREYPAGCGKSIGKWKIMGIRQYPEQECATLKVKVRMDTSGLMSLESPYQIQEVMVPVEEPAAAKKPAAPAKPDGKKDKEASAAEDSAAEMETDEPQQQKEASPTTETKLKKSTKKHELFIACHTHSATSDMMARWKELEGKMYAQDRLIIDTLEKKNALEEYVYDVRDKVQSESQWADFVDAKTKDAFLKQLRDTEDWLYSADGEEAQKSVYVDKLAALKKTGDPIAFLARESHERTRAERAFREYVDSVIAAVQAGDDKFSHIPADELSKVAQTSNTKINWLNDKLDKQAKLAKHAKPAVTSDEIDRERAELGKIVQPILTRPKPKPAVVEEKKAADEAKDAAESPASKKEDEKMDIDQANIEEIAEGKDGAKMELD